MSEQEMTFKGVSNDMSWFKSENGCYYRYSIKLEGMVKGEKAMCKVKKSSSSKYILSGVSF